MKHPAVTPIRKDLFQFGEFTLASGNKTVWKIECDALTSEDWDTLAILIYMAAYPYSVVEGVPTGGLELEKRLATKLYGPGEGLIIVDDVYTTGESMERQRAHREARGFVVFARRPITQPWIRAIFTMTL